MRTPQGRAACGHAGRPRTPHPRGCRDFEAFVGGLQDSEVPVRREAIQLLSAAVTTRPALAEAALPHAVPALLKLTKVDPSLIKEVNLGPFKQKQDEGLTSRKYAFECLEVRRTAARPIVHLDATLLLPPALCRQRAHGQRHAWLEMRVQCVTRGRGVCSCSSRGGASRSVSTRRRWWARWRRRCRTAAWTTTATSTRCASPSSPRRAPRRPARSFSTRTSCCRRCSGC